MGGKNKAGGKVVAKKRLRDKNIDQQPLGSRNGLHIAILCHIIRYNNPPFTFNCIYVYKPALSSLALQFSLTTFLPERSIQLALNEQKSLLHIPVFSNKIKLTPSTSLLTSRYVIKEDTYRALKFWISGPHGNWFQCRNTSVTRE